MTVKLTTTNKIRSEIAQLAKERERANEKIRVMVHNLQNGAKPLPEKRFWELVKELKRQLEQTKNRRDDDWNTRSGVHNFYCYNFTQDLMEMVRFVKTYDDKVTALHKSEKLNENITGCGDDRYGDTLDSFPLFGQQRYKRAIEKGNPYKNMKHLEAQYYKPIFQGENYICMTLNDHIIKVAGNMADDLPKPSEKIYRVTVVRTGWGSKDIVIQGAEDEAEARRMAMDKALDYEFTEHDADYRVEGVTEEEV